jgi:Tol biopolymer transport system component
MLRLAFITVALIVWACAGAGGSPTPALTADTTPTPAPTRVIHASQTPVSLGATIELASLSGRLVVDDFEDVYAMNVDGSNLVEIATNQAGPEFDGSWSPNGEWIAYRDSTRGINQDDEISVARSDGSEQRNVTNNPANDWGPDWSPDGSTIAFNSDREGGAGLGGYLMNPDGSNLRRIDTDVWFEYPSWSPDGSKIAFMGALGSNYEVFVIDVATGETTQLTDSPGHDAWPAWSPDGSTIAFTSVRDDCGLAPRDQECWETGDIGPHHDIWLIDVDGSNLRRVTPEFGQYVAWSPDSQYLLISGYALYVVRPDGTGRLELRADGTSQSLGGIPDWR